MKELVRHIFKRDYLSKHPVEDPRIASLIQIAEETKRGPFSEMEGYPKLLFQKFQEANPRFPRHLDAPIDRKWFLKLANQLYAVEQLGSSSDKNALDYLRHLSKEKINIISDGFSISGAHYRSGREFIYPNARGDLKRALSFKIDIITSVVDERGDEVWTPIVPGQLSARIQSEAVTIKQRSPAHEILNKAIAMLEQDLASA